MSADSIWSKPQRSAPATGTWPTPPAPPRPEPSPVPPPRIEAAPPAPPPSGAYVFLSYSRQQPDAGYVERLATMLSQAGVPVWFDGQLSSGDRWVHVLRDRVDACAAFVVLMSPNSEQSDFVGMEVQRALAGRRPVYPLLFDGRPFGRLTGIQYEQVHGGTAWPSQSFVDRLRGHVAHPPPPPGEGRAVLIGAGFPLRNPHFVGRDELFVDLESRLSFGSAVTVQALRGMGGVGKTQLAAEYAYRHQDDYDVIAWIDSEQATLIPSQLVGLAALLDVPVTADALGTADAVVAALGQSSLHWLVIFDNAEAPKDLTRWLPRAGSGDVIVTSRQSGWDALGSTVDVDVLTRPEAMALLREQVSTVDLHTAGDIVALLGELPLAVEQAAAFLAETGIRPEEYLRLLRNRGEELLDQGQVHGYEHTLATVWQLSQESLRRASPAGEQLLRLCAFLGPEPIPVELFTVSPDALPAPLDATAGDELLFAKALGALVSRSLARRTAEGIVVHRLLAAAIRRPLTESDRHAAVATVRQVLFRVLPSAAEILDMPENLPVWQELLPHVLAVVDHPAPHLGDSDPTSWLLDGAGTYLQVHGQFAGGLRLIERALQIDETAYGPNHGRVATRLNSLATVYLDLGRPADARPLLERTLHIAEDQFGRDDPRVAVALGLLAMALQRLGAAQEAKQLVERALRIDESAYGPDHPTVAIDLSRLIGILRALGDPQAALPLAQRAVRIDEDAYGPDHHHVAVALGNLASILRALGRSAEAEPMASRALRIEEAAYGPDHQLVALRLNNLGAVLHDLGRVGEARAMLERSLRIFEASLGLDHPDTELAREALASLAG